MHITIAANKDNSVYSKLFNTSGNNDSWEMSRPVLWFHPTKTQHGGVVNRALGKDTGTTLLIWRAGSYKGSPGSQLTLLLPHRHVISLPRTPATDGADAVVEPEDHVTGQADGGHPS